MPVLRMKAVHGDLGAASCPVELLACITALTHDTLPAGIRSTAARRHALVLSLGLFGESAALMLARPDAPER
jgi:hypothetical protein